MLAHVTADGEGEEIDGRYTRWKVVMPQEPQKRGVARSSLDRVTLCSRPLDVWWLDAGQGAKEKGFVCRELADEVEAIIFPEQTKFLVSLGNAQIGAVTPPGGQDPKPVVIIFLRNERSLFRDRDVVQMGLPIHVDWHGERHACSF